VRFTTGVIRVAPDRKHVTLPRLGTIKLHESARKLARRLEAGTARILSATVRREAGRWHVAFTCEVERSDRKPSRATGVVGVDVGIHRLAVLSTGDVEPNPRHLDAAQRSLRRLGRAVARKRGPYDPATRTPITASRRWERTSKRLSRQHARVANLRRDGLHKLTTRLAGEYATIVVEDLNVAGMVRNRRLARGHQRRRVRGDPPATRVQDRLERRPARDRRPVVSILQDLFGLRRGETQTAAADPDLHLPDVPSGPGPGSQRRTQPRTTRGRREWLGDCKRTWSRP
jgi:putative transposase